MFSKENIDSLSSRLIHSKSCNDIVDYSKNEFNLRKRSNSLVYVFSPEEHFNFFRNDSNDSLFSICSLESIQSNDFLSSQPKSEPIKVPIGKVKQINSHESLTSLSSSKSYDSLINEIKIDIPIRAPSKNIKRIRDSKIELSKSPQIKDVMKYLSISPGL